MARITCSFTVLDIGQSFRWSRSGTSSPDGTRPLCRKVTRTSYVFLEGPRQGQTAPADGFLGSIVERVQ